MSANGGAGSQRRQQWATDESIYISHGASAYRQLIAMPRPSNVPAFFSASGFDIIGILSRVASRPSPRVFIGPVDFSCCFLVADALQPDFPTVYVSPAFVSGMDNIFCLR
jgi:hypothetical protein